MTEVAPRPPLASVALLSSAALATEILLSRSFAVVHWHHFAYMMISVALLGYGASGTFLTIFPKLQRARPELSRNILSPPLWITFHFLARIHR